MPLESAEFPETLMKFEEQLSNSEVSGLDLAKFSPCQNNLNNSPAYRNFVDAN